MAPTNLYEFYTSQGKALPSLQERAKIYETQGLGSASSYAGSAEQNTALLSKLSSPAPVAVPTTPAPVPVTPERQTEAVYNNPIATFNYGAPIVLPGGKVAEAPATFTSITSPIPAPIPVPVTPTLPVPQAPAVTSDYFTSITSSLETQRKAVEDAYNKQITDLKTQMETSQKKIDEFTSSQQGALDQVKTLTEPFRTTLETAQRQKLYVDQNFEANQTLTNELGTLLQEGNDLIKQQKEVTGLAAIRNPRIAQTISDVAARAGVIQAVMAARNGQISQAYTMIDRTVTAMTADRKDQLDYYKSIYDFAQTQKDDEGKKLLVLTSDEKKYIEAKVALLESDLKTTQTNAEAFKKLFVDPDTALKFAKAGITLNTPTSEWGIKLADQAYAEEIAKVSNDRANDGYSTIPIPGVTPVQTIDSKGVKKNWYKKSTTGESESYKTEVRNAHNYIYRTFGNPDKYITAFDSDPVFRAQIIKDMQVEEAKFKLGLGPEFE